jgi:rare lipoprotein A
MKQVKVIVLALMISTVANAQRHKPKVIIGIASFYSANLHHTKTSSGEFYEHEILTGASNHFKLHTLVKVTNLRNGKSVIVRINDHMHKRMAGKGRVIDVSRSAAKKLGFLSHGITRVRLEEVFRHKNE